MNVMNFNDSDVTWMMNIFFDFFMMAMDVKIF